MNQDQLKTPARLLLVNPVIMWLLAAGMAFFGFQGKLLPFLYPGLGRSHEDIPQDILSFMLIPLFWIIGTLLIAYGLLLFLLIQGPFRHVEKWAYKAIFISLAVGLPLIEIATIIKYPYSPWAPFGLCIIYTILAFVKAKPHFK
ncbi:MAG: hypothetical protein RLQ12_02210 [Cyclobacteriaceae bacterium]